MRNTIRTLIAVAALSLAVTGCSSNSTAASSVAAQTSASAAVVAATSDSAPSTAAVAGSVSSVSTPTEAELLPSIQLLINPTVSPEDKAASVIKGTDLGPTLTKLTEAMTKFPNVTFKIQKITVTGSSARGSVQIISNGTPLEQLLPAFWEQDGGSWKITRAGACSLIVASGVTCPGNTVS